MITKHILIALTLATIASCGDKKENAAQQTTPKTDITVAQSGIRKMRSIDIHDTLTWNGTAYNCRITTQADESLPTVKDDQGQEFADNKIDLVVETKSGSPFFHQSFQKSNFDEHLSKEFKQKGVLEGMVFDKIIPQGLQFAVSVCIPQTDLYTPLIIIISKSGNVTIKKDNLMENTPAGSVSPSSTSDTNHEDEDTEE